MVKYEKRRGDAMGLRTVAEQLIMTKFRCRRKNKIADKICFKTKKHSNFAIPKISTDVINTVFKIPTPNKGI